MGLINKSFYGMFVACGIWWIMEFMSIIDIISYLSLLLKANVSSFSKS